MSKHTPGPWAIGIFPVSDKSEKVGIVGADSNYVATVSGYKGFSSTAADANLIAAAPELLAELEAFEQLIRDGESDDLGFHIKVTPICVERVKAIRAAIAKATTA